MFKSVTASVSATVYGTVFGLIVSFAGPLSAAPAKKASDPYKAKVEVYLPEIQKCYVDHLKTTSKGVGRITIDFDINDKGEVIKAVANPNKSNWINEKMNKCMTAKIMTWKFKPAPKGQTVYASFPFHFKNPKPAKKK